MSLLQNLRNRFFQRALKQQARQNTAARRSINFNDAQFIGLLFDATDLDEREIVFQYAEKLRDRHKRIKLLGFFDSMVEDSNFTFKYFNRKKLDWAQRPIGENVQEFAAQPFDLMIHLSTTAKPQMDYIAAISKAHLRIGPYSDNTFCYDVMIDSGSNKNLKDFIQQMESVLEKTSTRHETTQV